MITRKIVISALCALSLLALGCNKEEVQEPSSRNYETYDGEIKSLAGIKVNKMITHLFETKDGQILYAYSDRYDLNDPDYLAAIEAYGVIMTYDTIDKEVFEIRRISELDEEEIDEEEIEAREYKNSELGFKFTYLSNWELSEFYDSVRLVAPVEEVPAGELEDEETTDEPISTDPDYIIIARTEANLKLSSDNDITDRANEVRNYVRNNYDNLIGTGNDLSYLGVDQLFAVKYDSGTGDIIYFVPRGDELYELAFYHPGDLDKINNANAFAEIVSTFRFLPGGSEVEDSNDDTEEIEEEEVKENEEKELVIEEVEEEKEEVKEPVIKDTPPIDVSAYREFESNPFQFVISYPKNWYFSGGSNGYDFANSPIEDTTVPDVRLDINKSNVTGTNLNGNTYSVTVKVEDRFYTLSGESEFKDIMQEMASTIRSTAPDSE